MGNDASKGWHDFTSGVGDMFGAFTKPATTLISGAEHVLTHGEDVIGGVANTAGQTISSIGQTAGQTLSSIGQTTGATVSNLGKDAAGAVSGISHDVTGAVQGLGTDVMIPFVVVGGGIFALLFFVGRNNQVPQIVTASGEVVRAVR